MDSPRLAATRARADIQPSARSTSRNRPVNDPPGNPPRISSPLAQPPLQHGFTAGHHRPNGHGTPHLLGWLVLLLSVILSIYLLSSIATSHHASDPLNNTQPQRPIPNANPQWANAHEWIRTHATMHPSQKDLASKPKAALISLVRNEELEGILQSMRQLEYRWNKRYGYPWLFFSEAATTNATTSSTEYHLIPREHWHTPSFLTTTPSSHIYHDSLSYLSHNNIGKSHLPSYRSMCRWNSRFFFLHPALASYSYYWRVEPAVHFYCNIPYDPFRFMTENGLMYGFNMNILDDARSFASLLASTKRFLNKHPEYITSSARENVKWLLDPRTGTYNGCQFFSNFEIGSLDFFRSEEVVRYVEWLDGGEGEMGFWTERWGDAPVHTLAVVLFGEGRSWWFGDVGYRHDGEGVCNQGNIGSYLLNGDHKYEVRGVARNGSRVDGDRKSVRRGGGVSGGLCQCERTSIDENFYRLVPMESPQEKPRDTCLRMWLGGSWLEKREGWDGDVERMVGGDGFGGYVRQDF